MPDQYEGISGRRRYARVTGPFGARHLGLRKTHVLVYDLNLGGGFVNFTDEQPEDSTFMLRIKLPEEGPITVKAETVHRHPAGIGVRFVDVDVNTSLRLARTVEASLRRHPATA